MHSACNKPSNVQLGSRLFHLPMIDFPCPQAAGSFQVRPFQVTCALFREPAGPEVSEHLAALDGNDKVQGGLMTVPGYLTARQQGARLLMALNNDNQRFH